MPTAGDVRLLSFNVNGLRACLKRLGITLAALLERLGADIVCSECAAPSTHNRRRRRRRGHSHTCSLSPTPRAVQETKLRQSDVTRELAVVEGW